MNDKQMRLVEEWSDSRRVAMNIAADVAIGIQRGRIKSLPTTTSLALEWDTTGRGAQKDFKLLGDAGIIKKDDAGR